MIDRNGYAPSILQVGEGCFLCQRRDQKLDRHEVFGGPYRTKSKALGLWVLLCHDSCHLNGVHKDADLQRHMRAFAQNRAMTEYGWTVQEFRHRFGKNYLEEN